MAHTAKWLQLKQTVLNIIEDVEQWKGSYIAAGISKEFKPFGKKLWPFLEKLQIRQYTIQQFPLLHISS